MAAKPLTTEAIALTEKKMDMTLDDIIRMSKKPITTTKSTTNAKVNNRRVSNKNPKPFNNAAAVNQGNASRARRFMDSRSSLRQGALAQRRSNFQANQFPNATEAARKAAAAPIRNRPFNQFNQFNRNRMTNWNKPRVDGSPVQRRPNVGFVIEKTMPQPKMGLKQRAQTLDSLFANMKEQRMRVQQNMARRQGAGGAQLRQRGRGRYGNFAN